MSFRPNRGLRFVVLPDILVTNLHRRYTGVSATIKALIPHQAVQQQVGLWDTGGLKINQATSVSLWLLLRRGWSKPLQGRYRVWHARRDIEIFAGVFFRSILRQPWRVVFTSAAPKRPGFFLRQLIGWCDELIATSDRSASFLERSAVVIHHGIDTHYFSPPVSRQEKQALWQARELPGRYAIGVFGRIRPSKGTDLFLRAMLELLPRYPDFVAVLSGLCQPRDRAYLDELHHQIQRADLRSRVIFLGDLRQEEILGWYRTIHLCVAASRTEGFGLTPLEAAACGVPVVTSEAGVWPQLIRAPWGRLFKTDSLDSLTAVLADLMQNPLGLQRMGEQARAHAEAHFSISNEVRGIQNVYYNLTKLGCN